MDDAKAVVVERWLVKAGNDLRTAELAVGAEPPVTDTACFHAQQCAEKCLKAFLTHADQHIERTHDLVRLLEVCTTLAATFRSIREQAASLTDYAVAVRYPDHWRDIPPEEALEAISAARDVREFVKVTLGS